METRLERFGTLVLAGFASYFFGSWQENLFAGAFMFIVFLLVLTIIRETLYDR